MNERRKRKNVNASEYERARENSYLTEYMYRKKKIYLMRGNVHVLVFSSSAFASS